MHVVLCDPRGPYSRRDLPEPRASHAFNLGKSVCCPPQNQFPVELRLPRPFADIVKLFSRGTIARVDNCWTMRSATCRIPMTFAE